MFDETRLGRIVPWMQSYVDDRKFAGCSVLIGAGGQEAYFHATGLADLANEAPFERDTVVRIYSMTKPITSAVLMMLVEEGRVSLQTPLSAILPEFSDMSALKVHAQSIDDTEPCHAPTLHQLLTHTSGLSYAFNPGVLPQAMEEEEVFFAPAQGSLASMCEKLATLPLAFKPGARWEYSVGIDVIGRVIEVLEDAPLDRVFAKRILDPLEMRDTSFLINDNALERAAQLYTPLSGNAMGLNDRQLGSDTLRLADDSQTSQLRQTTLFSGGGGLVGTINDYMAFTQFLLTGRAKSETLLSQSTLAFMRSNHLQSDIASMGAQSFAEQPMFGMGFGIGGAVVLNPALTGVPSSVGDFSWGGMASTFFWVDPSHDMSVVFFTQLAPSSSYPVRAELKALVHGALQ